MNEKTFNLLVVDDDRSSIEILLVQLAGLYNVTPALNGKRAMELVEKLSFDLILLDIMMPDMDGFQVAQLLKQGDETHDIPIIFITAKQDEASIERAFDLGGVDYVTKPFLQKELLARIKTQLKMLSLIRHLDNLSSFDQLSGIYNRRKFFELGQQLFEQPEKGLYAVMIDIDNFKMVNDLYGHASGDNVIRTVAQTIKGQLPEDAVFGRLGGEEFAILCRNIDQVTLMQQVERYRKEVEETSIEMNDGKMLDCTISCGVSVIKEKFDTLDRFLDDADTALYEAKGGGKNRITFRV